MKRIALVLSLIVLGASGPGAQAPAPANRTISVNGSADVRVPPNEVVLAVGVETDSPDITRARAENDSRIKAIGEVARAQGVPPEHVRTDYLDIQPRYRDDYSRREFLGFFARRSLAITLRDVTKFDALLSAVLGAGANYVHGVDFRTTELRKHRDAARELALRAAREKAVVMAKAMGVTIGSPLTIHEGYSGWWSPHSSWWGNRPGGMMAQNSVQATGGAPSEDALMPGQISVSANVTVTFELAGR